MKFLFCQLRNHGDIIRTFPLLDSIKANYPNCYIGFTCYEEMVETCKICKSIDVIIPQPRFKPVVNTEGGTRILDCNLFEDVVNRVRLYEFDVYVDLHGVFQSALFGAMCNIKIRLGRSKETAKDGAHIFYTDVTQISDKEINRMERHFIIFNKLFPDIRPLQIKNNLGDKVIIFPGSSTKGRLKRWKLENYVSIAKEIEKHHEVIFGLGPEEIEIYDNLINNGINPSQISIINNWRDIQKLLSECKLTIGNDGAYIHFSIWKNIPSVMICGPLSPVINGVWKYGVGDTVYYYERCDCVGLWQGICRNQHKCLDGITIDEVMATVIRYLR